MRAAMRKASAKALGINALVGVALLLISKAAPKTSPRATSCTEENPSSAKSPSTLPLSFLTSSRIGSATLRSRDHINFCGKIARELGKQKSLADLQANKNPPARWVCIHTPTAINTAVGVISLSAV